MKKYLIILLALLLIVPAVLGLSGSAAEEVGVTPFYVLNAWGQIYCR